MSLCEWATKYSTLLWIWSIHNEYMPHKQSRYPLAFLPWEDLASYPGPFENGPGYEAREDHGSKLIWPPDCDQCTGAILTLQPALMSESPPVLLLLHLWWWRVITPRGQHNHWKRLYNLFWQGNNFTGIFLQQFNNTAGQNEDKCLPDLGTDQSLRPSISSYSRLYTSRRRPRCLQMPTSLLANSDLSHN